MTFPPSHLRCLKCLSRANTISHLVDLHVDSCATISSRKRNERICNFPLLSWQLSANCRGVPRVFEWAKILCLLARTHARMHARMHARTHARMHARTHAHTQACTSAVSNRILSGPKLDVGIAVHANGKVNFLLVLRPFHTRPCFGWGDMRTIDLLIGVRATFMRTLIWRHLVSRWNWFQMWTSSPLYCLDIGPAPHIFL